MRRKLQGARLLITGASSGIGREIALQASRQGAVVFLAARREQRLQCLVKQIREEGGFAHFLAGDITNKIYRSNLFDSVSNELGGLDILVNNAGAGAYGPFAEATQDRLRQLMELNFFAPVEMCRLFLPLLLSGGSPCVCNISSILAHRAVPGKSEYCASKFALHGFSDALRAEWANLGIDIVLVSPSTTTSEFSGSVIEKTGKPPAEGKFARSPASVAAAAIRAIERGTHEVIPSYSGRVLVWLDRYFPRLADFLVAKLG